MKQKQILLDVDGVLLNWLEGFKVYMKHQGYSWVDYETQEYDMCRNFNITSEEVTYHIRNFNQGHWEFGILSPIYFAQEALGLFSNPLVAISSCSTNPITIALRKANLFHHYGDRFEAVHCVSENESKKTHLADYDSCIWIEDHFDNCVDGLEYGHKCLLLTKSWNEKYFHPDIIRCNSWWEIAKIIQETPGYESKRTN